MAVTTQQMLENLRARRGEQDQPAANEPEQATEQAGEGETEDLTSEMLRLRERRRVDPIMGLAAGANTVTSNMLGLPGDIGFPSPTEPLKALTPMMALRSLGITDPEPSLMPSSREIKEGLAGLGILTDQDMELSEQQPATRALFRAGETFFGSVPFLGGAFAFARLSPGTGPVRESIRSAPGTFTARETGAATGAAGGAGVAETADPGDPTSRLSGEVAGSFMGPGQMFRVLSKLPLIRAGMEGIGFGLREGGIAVGEPISRILDRGGPVGKHLGESLRALVRAGKERRAADIVADVVQATGEDPQQLARALERADEFGLTLTSGQKTGSKAMVALDHYIAARDAEFQGVRESLQIAAHGRLRETIDGLIATGDPTALRVAARLRQRYFDTLLSERLRYAEREAAERLARLGPVSGEARAKASKAAFKPVDEALRHARGVETSLYEKIPKRINTVPTNLDQSATTLRSELDPGAEIPMAGRINEMQGQIVTSGDLLSLRRDLYAEARKAGAAGDHNRRRQLYDLAHAVEDDIGALGVQESDAAREWTHALHDKFSRTFAGEALARSRTGGQRIAPEEMMGRAFGRGGEGGARRTRELEEAAAFPGEAGPEAAGGVLFSGAVRNAQEAFLRDVSAQFVENGRVNPEKLRRFVADNDELLQRFPRLRQDLQDAESAERLLRDVARTTETARKRIYEKAAFARIANIEDPSRFIAEKLRGDSPRKDFRQLAKMASRSGDGATAGLRTSSLDAARNNAINDQGVFSWRRFHREVFEPRGEQRPALMQLMQENGVITAEQANRLRRMTERAIEIENAMRDPSRVNELISEADPIFDLATRIIGANIGAGVLPAQATGTAIVQAGAGSRFARRLMEKVPATRTFDILLEAAERPQLMAALLRKPKSLRQRRAQLVQIRSSLIQAGLLPKSGDTEIPALEVMREEMNRD